MQNENQTINQEVSFSAKIKEELSNHWTEARHCQIAEITAIISMCGRITIDSRERYAVKVKTENISVARKYFTLLKKTFNIEAETFVSRNLARETISYTVAIKGHEEAMKVLQAAKLVDAEGEISEELSVVKNMIIQHSCCKRAFIRGVFLVSGSISNPEKSYHIEIVCSAQKKAEQIKSIINSFGLEAKVIVRKKSYVVYIKEAEQIVDLLNVMEATNALMDMENIRILKDIRNTVNRKVNCEAANINKTVSAAGKQIEDIRYIQERIGLKKLPEGLLEMAEVRLEYPNASLKELGELLSTPIGKSGVNHRLRKLSEIADRLREHREEIV